MCDVIFQGAKIMNSILTLWLTSIKLLCIFTYIVQSKIIDKCLSGSSKQEFWISKFTIWKYHFQSSREGIKMIFLAVMIIVRDFEDFHMTTSSDLKTNYRYCGWSLVAKILGQKVSKYFIGMVSIWQILYNCTEYRGWELKQKYTYLWYYLRVSLG